MDHTTILQNAHQILFGNKRYAGDLVAECDMIRKGIKDLYLSNRFDKYAIMMRLAEGAGLTIDPQYSLKDITLAVRSYYMDTCLSINPEVRTRLAILWGQLGAGHQVVSYDVYCKNISRKIKQAYRFDKSVEEFNTPFQIANVLYGPNVGIIEDLEEKQGRIGQIQHPNNDDIMSSNVTDLLKLHSAYLILNKLIFKKYTGTNLTAEIKQQIIQQQYEELVGEYDGEDLVRSWENIEDVGDRRTSNYVSPSPNVTENEKVFFREFHKNNAAGNRYQYNIEDIKLAYLIRIYDYFIGYQIGKNVDFGPFVVDGVTIGQGQTYDNTGARTDVRFDVVANEGLVEAFGEDSVNPGAWGRVGLRLEPLTDEEANFIKLVQQRYVDGVYPVDMLWDDLCRSF